MNIEEHIDQLDCFENIIRQGVFFSLAVRDTVAMQSERIFLEGESSAGGRIGQYDMNKPVYVNPLKVPKGSALHPLTGKTGKDKFKSGKKHRTRYVSSYAELRKLMGLQTAYVDLLLFGNLKSDFENGGRGTGIVPLRVDDLTFRVTLDGENVRKKQGLEDKYGSIFILTDKEEDNVAEVGVKHLTIELERCLQR